MDAFLLKLFVFLSCFTAVFSPWAARGLASGEPGSQKKESGCKEGANYDTNAGAKYDTNEDAKYDTALHISEDANYAASLLWDPAEALLTEYARWGDPGGT